MKETNTSREGDESNGVTAANSKMLNKEQASAYEKLSEAPVTVLQIGEGNFLRGFFNWMIHESRKQGLYDGSIAVVQPRQAVSRRLRR